jgi:dihydropteroate synthase
VIVNDVAGLRDPAMAEVCRETGVGVVVMHMQGTPATMQVNPTYGDVVRDTMTELQSRLAEIAIPADRVCLDPGIGFGKTLPQTLDQLKRLGEYCSLGRPICLGVSRKGFLGQITGRDRPDRLAGTLSVNAFAMAMRAAQIVRVHDVAAHRDAALLAGAIFA